MRVLFLSQIVPYPPHGGVLQRGYNILRELSRHADVHLLAFVHADLLPTPQARDESRRALAQFCEAVEYFPLWAKSSRFHHAAALGMSACSSMPYSTIAHRSTAYEQRTVEVLQSKRFDLVHVDTIALSQFAGAVRHLPTALTHHNIESQLMARRAEVERRPLARRFLFREAGKLAHYEARISPRHHVNIMMSATDEATLRERVPGVRTAVVPNGVDVAYFAPPPVEQRAESPTLIYTGGMNMFANRDAVEYFLSAIWPRITAQLPGVRFCAVGQDPPKGLLDLAARDPRVVVTGYVDDIRPHVHNAAVYVVPLRVGGGTRLKVLDAMAMGKAVVSTSIGCEGIDVVPGQHLMTADSPDAFAAAILALLANPRQRLELGSAARALVAQRYAWPVIGGRLFDAYQCAIKNEQMTS